MESLFRIQGSSSDWHQPATIHLISVILSPLVSLRAHHKTHHQSSEDIWPSTNPLMLISCLHQMDLDFCNMLPELTDAFGQFWLGLR